MYIVSPFTNSFCGLPNISYSHARQIAALLNPPSKTASNRNLDQLTNLIDQDTPASPELTGSEFSHDQQVLSSQLPAISPGYTTVDAAGADGDDTIHSPIPVFDVPRTLGSCTQAGAGDATLEKVNLEYVDSIRDKIAFAAEQIGLAVNVSRDSENYLASNSLADVMVDWVSKHWPCDE